MTNFNTSSSISKAYTFLDNFRHTKGLNSTKSYFDDLAHKNTEDAINLVNDTDLHYSSLLLLKDDIHKYNLYENLNLRNRIALNITDEILESSKPDCITPFSCDHIQNANYVLKWMLKTDSNDSIPIDNYDRVLDSCAALLTKVYNDSSALPLIVDIIFDRHRKNHFINNLVWAFFEEGNPKSLIYIANYLLSSHPKDVELAHKLLKFIPGINLGIPDNQYVYFGNWLKENSMFLYYTGEGFQQSHKPTPYKVVLEGKYLYKFVSIDTGTIMEVLTKKEEQLLSEFKKLDYSLKVLLSTFSYNLYRKDIYYWHSWINYPISKQISMARLEIQGGRI